MIYDLKPLSEQTIVVTGASSGIGLATARRAAREGAEVIMVARNGEALEQAAADICAGGGKARAIVADVAEMGAARRIGEEAGHFDTWVNNAASAMYAPLKDVTMEEHRRVFETGYFGLVEASLYAVERLRDKGGALINLGSVLSEHAIMLQGPYCAMKHAVLGFTEALRMELQDEGAPVSVTLIKPSGIDTPYPEHARNKMGEPARIPPIVYDPELVAKAICFAAAHPRRDLLVGGQGTMFTVFGNLFPGTTDFLVRTMIGKTWQTDDTPPEPGAVDNLFEPREDGRVHSNQSHYVRKTSLALEAQMHPLATALAIGGGAAALIAGAAMGARRNGRA